MLAKCLATVALAAALVAPATAAHRRTPALRVAALKPVHVLGSGFAARERVRIRLSSDGTTWSKVVRTTRTGTFDVSFAAAFVDRCTGYVLFARGGTGDEASAKGMPFACPPAP